MYKRQDERSDQPDAGEARLVEEHGIRRAVVLVGGDHRRRQDHDQPDEQQRCGDPDEDVVGCLLYTSDAADERSRVDLGGRRIIKKKSDQAREQIRRRESQPKQ